MRSAPVPDSYQPPQVEVAAEPTPTPARTCAKGRERLWPAQRHAEEEAQRARHLVDMRPRPPSPAK